jgi:hypothetical protein
MLDWPLPSELESVSSKGPLLRLRRYSRQHLSAREVVTQPPTTAYANLQS